MTIKKAGRAAPTTILIHKCEFKIKTEIIEEGIY